MPDDSQDDREQGVDFGPLADELTRIDYPVAHDELVEEFGDYEIELPDETVHLREVLGPETQSEYESAENVRQSVLNMVGAGAVGRRHYSDRGDAHPDERESF